MENTINTKTNSGSCKVIYFSYSLGHNVILQEKVSTIHYKYKHHTFLLNISTISWSTAWQKSKKQKVQKKKKILYTQNYYRVEGNADCNWQLQESILAVWDVGAPLEDIYLGYCSFLVSNQNNLIMSFLRDIFF